MIAMIRRIGSRCYWLGVWPFGDRWLDCRLLKNVFIAGGALVISELDEAFILILLRLCFM